MLNASYQAYIAAGGNIPDNMYSTDRAVKKLQAKPALSMLTVPLATPYGSVGPFITSTPDTWYVGASNMGAQIAGNTLYIGFDSALGFQDVGAD